MTMSLMKSGTVKRHSTGLSEKNVLDFCIAEETDNQLPKNTKSTDLSFRYTALLL